MPIGLIKEIQRHFLTFLNVFSPESFHCVQNNDDEYVFLKFNKNNALNGFLSCCRRLNIDIDHLNLDDDLFRIARRNFLLVKMHIQEKFLKLTKPYHVTAPRNCVRDLQSILNESKCLFRENNGIFTLSLSDILLLDNLLADMGCESDIEQQTLDWSRREGNEHYYFGDCRDFIELFMEKSLSLEDRDAVKLSDCYDCLVPIETSFIARQEYIDVLKKFFKELGEKRGYTELEGKRIVHFQRIAITEAIPKIIGFFDYNYGGMNDNLLKLLRAFATQNMN
jgi:hypothetical protein